MKRRVLGSKVVEEGTGWFGWQRTTVQLNLACGHRVTVLQHVAKGSKNWPCDICAALRKRRH